MCHFQRYLILHVIIPIARQSASVMEYSCACQNHRTKTFHVIYCFVGFVLFCLFCCLLFVVFFRWVVKHLSIDVVQRFYCSWSVFTTMTSTIADTHHVITLPRIETSGISPWESYFVSVTTIFISYAGPGLIQAICHCHQHCCYWWWDTIQNSLLLTIYISRWHHVDPVWLSQLYFNPDSISSTTTCPVYHIPVIIPDSSNNKIIFQCFYKLRICLQLTTKMYCSLAKWLWRFEFREMIEHQNHSSLYRLSMGCHTVSPAPVWVRIPGP